MAKGKSPERYDTKCIIQLGNGLFIGGNEKKEEKQVESIHDARVFINPYAAHHVIYVNYWRKEFKEAILLPVRMVQVGKPLKYNETTKKWYKGES